MPERRRQRQQRVRHEAGGGQNSVRASNQEVKASNNETEKKKEEPAKEKDPVPNVVIVDGKVYQGVTVRPVEADPEAEEGKKYKRRQILNNWSRYEEAIQHVEDDQEQDYMLGEDFAAVIEQNVGSSGTFRFKGELSWEQELGILNTHGLGALKVADLVSALATVPLHVQLNLEEERLPSDDIDFYSCMAEDNKKLYKPSLDYVNTDTVNEKLLQSLKIVENEPLNLESETPEVKTSTKSSVDVALTLENYFIVDEDEEEIGTDLLPPEPEPEPVPEPVPEVKKKEVIVPEPQVTVVEPKPASAPPISKAQTPPLMKNTKVEFSIPKLDTELGTKKEPPKLDFNFGLPRQSSPTEPLQQRQRGKKKSPTPVPQEKEEEISVKDPLPPKEKEEEPAVDLDAPVKIEKKPVLLVNETEQEDLEDWLDSVLDD
ncbi:uncharacterized protein LOC143034360 [Oratosquilla oratoria]|uniref:uncharacterized protein LOC143034360 n=1 Tax=Oratosquilla oratoria TaxID=337810 RepID=UPI003F75FFB6